MGVAMTFWGGNWACAKMLEPLMGTSSLVFYRFFFAALGFLPLILYKKISFRLTKKEMGIMALCSVLMGIYQVIFFIGLHEGLPGAGGVLVTTMSPLITFALMAIIKRKGLEKKEWMGIGLGGLSAVFFLKLWTLNTQTLFDAGNSYFLIAALTWSVLTIVSQRLKISSLLYNFYAFGLVTPFLVIGTPIHELLSVCHQGLNFWIPMGFIVICGTVFSTTLYFFVTKTSGAKVAASYIFLVPTSAMIFAVLLLHEKPTWQTIVGGLLALAGVYILNSSSIKPEKETI